jgi:hypothetical protein
MRSVFSTAKKRSAKEKTVPARSGDYTQGGSFLPSLWVVGNPSTTASGLQNRSCNLHGSTALRPPWNLGSAASRYRRYPNRRTRGNRRCSPGTCCFQPRTRNHRDTASQPHRLRVNENYFAMLIQVVSSLEFRNSSDPATNSDFVHLNYFSNCLPTVHKEVKYESSCCPPIWRS